MNALQPLFRGDGMSIAVAVLLLVMSVGTWVVILWKGWLLRRALRDVARSTAAFWQARSLDDGRAAVQVFDRELLLQPLIEATRMNQSGTLAASGDASQQLTRLLRDALHGVLLKLQAGQVWLATVGATAPFVGLLGTVWGIYHALLGISGGTQVSID
ncbi:MAG: MotA/TolQ/ExbB proton channel family protein, partial [Candidatus Saccharibacteria bacterium]|nr:MotA/TolQ/ExbB proton channel family protein [Rhodoferax sp.]